MAACLEQATDATISLKGSTKMVSEFFCKSKHSLSRKFVLCFEAVHIFVFYKGDYLGGGDPHLSTCGTPLMPK